MLIPPLESIINESDVEQKLIMPFLKNVLGYGDEEIKTKNYLSPSDIDKGAGKKIGYYPDYAIFLGGIPVLVVEAKAPEEEVEEGYREARLYANEINKNYPRGINPVSFILACNGRIILVSPFDSEVDAKQIEVENLAPGRKDFDFIFPLISRETMIKYARKVRSELLPIKRFKPLKLIGGPSRQSAELAPNTFAPGLVPLLRKYFDPDETKSSLDILERGYCSSDQLTKYNSTLEALLKERIYSKKGFEPLETTKKATPKLTRALEKAYKQKREVPDPFILIIGNVGAGKSMFLERYQKFLMDEDIANKTLWTVVDFNRAPDDLSDLENWMSREFVRDFAERNGNEEFFDFKNLRRYFAPDILMRTRGPYKLLKETDVDEYTRRLTDDITNWFDDQIKLCSGIVRYFVKDKDIPIIAVFDNVDKRDRDQQLRVFQAVQWFRSINNCFTILSLRDETYDAYKDEPPLDAFLKPFAFRVIPPRFVNVVKKRLELAIEHLKKDADNILSYTLPNGFTITYPSTKLGRYLLNMYVSAFHPQRSIRLILEALSGRNIRHALEMFTDILISGYIREDLIFSITEGEGNEIPEWLIIKVLMRTKYKFFADNHGYIQNIFALPEDSMTAHNFLLVELLEFLAKRRKFVTSLRIEGYHHVTELIRHMVKLGFVKEDIMWALELSLRRGLIGADNQRNKGITEDDYVRITASGYYHIRFLSSRIEYLSSVAIDTWYNDRQVARSISNISLDRSDHRLRRIKLLKEYLSDEQKKLYSVISEFESSEEGTNSIIERIEKEIEYCENTKQ